MTPSDPPPRMPLSILLVFGLSVGALLVTAGFLPLPVLFFGVAVTSYFLDTRLVGNNPNRWFLRLGLILVIYLANPDQARDTDWAIGTARLRNLFAQYYAAEVALQFFRVHPRTETADGDPVRPRLIALVLSGMIFLSASNTFEELWIRWLTPIWVVVAVWSLISLRPRASGGALTASLRAVALFAAVAAGMGGYVAVYGQRGALNELASRAIRIRPQYEGNGMAESPRLGETFDLRGSPTRVLRIEKFNGDSHWRGLSFDEYDHGRWGPSFVQRRYVPVDDNILSPPQSLKRTDTQDLTVSRLTGGNPLVYAPLGLASLSLNEEDVNTQVSLETGGPFRVRVNPPFIYLVTVTQEENYQGILATPLAPPYRARCLQLPDGFDPRVRELAQRIVTAARARTDREKAEAIAAHLISTHQYSLRYRPTTPTDPIVGFLVDSPAASAHCEYFAAGTALMLRTVGVPTRYVTGYLAHEGEGTPGNVIVRQQDAHAWCEAYLDGVGWVTVDATPGSGRPDKNPAPVDKWRRVQEWFQDRWAQISGFLGELTSAQGRPIVLGVLTLLIGVGIIGYVRALRRQAATGWQYQAGPPSVAALQARFDSALARRGLQTPPATPYGEYLREQPLSLLVETARQWVQTYEHARFGDPSPQTLERLDGLTRDVEKAAQASPPPAAVEKV